MERGAGPGTAARGERRRPESGPPGPPRRGPFRAPGGGRPTTPDARRTAGPVVARRRLAVLLVLVLVAGFCGWALYGSSWLRVQRVTVSGTRVLTADQVRRAAAVRPGTPLASVDTDGVAERLRRALPRIDSVDVVRSWPHGIGLKVVERSPALLIEKGGKFIEVDAKGVRFATVPVAVKGVPRLELATKAEPGTAASLRRFGPGRLVGAAVRVAGDLPDAVAREARVLKVRSYDSISVELARGRVVVWGSDERGAEKAATLTALMKAAPRARHFDVSVPTAPAVAGS
ncbi:cell division protein FtsQ [Streptomyces sulfonofaciens]|uniref:Cell division protein FtsQ n=1 Tax=Streptomyces sulfonofaciens TaxID=68272 RepID=A0A919FX93_9ACTN|nr:FtsQ-type POTRA domain-containing protein [Streptomyces sulfonofaciens]GHH74212.1 cell division protein FtsQ [Streptomyces sulfonofaciens]